jgi:hypothetical protein
MVEGFCILIPVNRSLHNTGKDHDYDGKASQRICIHVSISIEHFR